MKLKVYDKKVIDFVWENMMTSFFVADGPSKLGPSTRQKTRSSYFPCKVYNLKFTLKNCIPWEPYQSNKILNLQWFGIGCMSQRKQDLSCIVPCFAKNDKVEHAKNHRKTFLTSTKISVHIRLRSNTVKHYILV
jgi:hypothetical protein